MNSLTELNGYSGSFSIEYTDQRLATVLFDRATAINQSVIVNEGSNFLLPVGIEITDIANYGTAAVVYEIDISAVDSDGVTLNFGTLPSGVAVSETGGVYTVSGISSAGVWNQIKSPTVQLPTNVPDAFFGNFTAAVEIRYFDALLGNLTKTYTVAVSVLNVTFLTNPLESFFDPNATTDIANTPQIVDLDATYPSAVWTITATVSTTTPISTIQSDFGGGGGFTFNNSTKGFLISGTRAQVNGHLNSMSVTATSSGNDFTITYILSNNQDGTTDSKLQTVRNSDVRFLSAVVNASYVEDSKATITGFPTITDSLYTGSDSYTLTITPDSTTKVTRLFATERDTATTTVSGTVASYTETVSITQLEVGQQYIILDIGSAGNESDFRTVGAAVNAVDTVFTATGTGTGGGIVEEYPRLRSMRFLNAVDGTGNQLRIASQGDSMNYLRFGNFVNYTMEMWIKNENWISATAPATGVTSTGHFFIGRNEPRNTTAFGFNKNGEIILNYTNDITGETNLKSAGSGATATATRSGGTIQSITVSNGGSGYVYAPFVKITGNGTGATAVANLTDGVVTSITVTNPGSGYTSAGVTISNAGLLNQWQHIAFVKQNTSLKLYVDGRIRASGSVTTGVPRYDDLGFDVYAAIGGHTYGNDCYIREFRVSDTARYTTDTFTPNTGPFTNDFDTLCLIHGTSTGGNVIDVNVTENGTFADDGADFSGGGDETWNNSIKRLSITGTKSAVNARLPYLRLIPESDIDSTIVLTYNVTTPESNTASKEQSVFVTGNDTEMTNASLTRSYLANTSNTIFSTNPPQITDNDQTGNNSYAVFLSCDFGDFTLDDVTLSSPFSIAGTRLYINNTISNIKFYPDPNVSSNFTMSIQLQKNSVTTANFTANLNGTPNAFTGSRDVYFYTTQTFTPSLLDVKYGKISEMVVVGGGGGGSGGGGGGGRVRYLTGASVPNNGLLTLQTYTVTVGAGGSAGNSDLPPNAVDGGNGGNSSAFGITAEGGFGGGRFTDFFAGTLTYLGTLNNWQYQGGYVTGGNGGSSYGPDGTLYSGGTSGFVPNGVISTQNQAAAEYKYAITGGGGAGSGGSLAYATSFTTSGGTTRFYSLNGYPQISGGTETVWDNTVTQLQGCAGIGVYSPLGGDKGAFDSTNPSDVGYRDSGSFGFGGAASKLHENSGSALGGAGSYWFESEPFFTTYSNGGRRAFDDFDNIPNNFILPTVAQDNPRNSIATVAGGGGASGVIGHNSVVPPRAGGDGIVIIRIAAQ